MKYLIAILMVASMVSAVSGATGSTSTGSTSTGTVSTGSISTPAVIGGGGITRGFNTTTKQYDMVPQCFPWAWLLDFYQGNIFMIYENQAKCRAQRLIDFGV